MAAVEVCDSEIPRERTFFEDSSQLTAVSGHLPNLVQHFCWGYVVHVQLLDNGWAQWGITPGYFFPDSGNLYGWLSLLHWSRPSFPSLYHSLMIFLFNCFSSLSPFTGARPALWSEARPASSCFLPFFISHRHSSQQTSQTSNSVMVTASCETWTDILGNTYTTSGIQKPKKQGKREGITTNGRPQK